MCDKIIQLLKKMSNSKGVSKVAKSTGSNKLLSVECDIMKVLKSYFQESILQENVKPERATFLDIIKNYSHKY